MSVIFAAMVQSNKKDFNPKLKNSIVSFICINDLREKEVEGGFLSEKELKALYNFDKYRIAELSKLNNEQDYHKRFSQLRLMAQLMPYEEFLEMTYNS